MATYNLLNNAARLVEKGFGAAITIEGLVNASRANYLDYRPLKDSPTLQAYLAWKPFQFRSNACKVFLEEAKKKLTK